ncbi:MAG: DUF5686 family protein, partial [Bacteroidota bacterium]
LETSTKGYWKAPNSYREEIIARKQPPIFPAEFNLLSASTFSAQNLPNLNDDRVILFRRNVVGPTAPDAFDFYSYKLIDTTAVDNFLVWRIAMTPKSTIVPLFEGTISIADSSFLVMEVDLRGNEALNEPPFTNIELRQQFALYEDRFWLPIQCTFSFIPQLGFTRSSTTSRITQTSVVSDYKINLDLSTSDFDRFSLRVLPTADQVDSLSWNRLQAIPLTLEETKAYQFWDSVMAAKSWRRDLGMFLIRAPLEYQRIPITTFSDFYRFNRVEGSVLGIGLDSKEFFAPTRLTLRGSYGFADQSIRYGFGVEQHLTDNRQWAFGGDVFHALKTIGDRKGFSPFSVTLTSLFGKQDPLDYYDTIGGSLLVRGEVLPGLVAEFRGIREQHRSVHQQTDFSLFRPSASFRPNPSIDEGRLYSSALILAYDSRKYIDAGFFRFVDDTRESWFIETLWEYSGKRYFGSDFEFGRLTAHAQRSQFTWGTGKISMLVNVQWSTGSLPLQRYFVSGVKAAGIVTAGALKTLGVEGLMGSRAVVA